jgi:hypothetical protein
VTFVPSFVIFVSPFGIFVLRVRAIRDLVLL